MTEGCDIHDMREILGGFRCGVCGYQIAVAITDKDTKIQSLKTQLFNHHVFQQGMAMVPGSMVYTADGMCNVCGELKAQPV